MVAGRTNNRNNNNNKKQKKGKKYNKGEIEPPSENTLNRFAGSSEEENEIGDEVEEDNVSGGIIRDNDNDELVKSAIVAYDEDNNDDDNDDDSGNDGDNANVNTLSERVVSDDNNDHDNDGDDEGEKDDYDDASSDDDEYGSPHPPSSTTGVVENGRDGGRTTKMAGQFGMSGAMARILNSGLPRESKATAARRKGKNNDTQQTIILSKGTTPLQKLQKKHKAEQGVLRERRRTRRSTNLTVMHAPLSTATSLTITTTGNDGDTENGMALSRELESERMHRRVATRGVVSLFNAITQHQQAQQNNNVSSTIIGPSSSKSSGNDGELKRMNKHTFLDMIKKSGGGGEDKKDEGKDNGKRRRTLSIAHEHDTTGNSMNTSSSGTANQGKKKVAGDGWNALKDDFMMSSKLKDWDKNVSDDDDDDDADDDDEAFPSSALD